MISIFSSKKLFSIFFLVTNVNIHQQSPAMDNLLDKLEQICKCGVCLERFNDPKQLSCQHIFCQRCLMKACITNKMGLMSLFCPTCRERQPMVYNSYDVMKLKPSFFINQILEVVVEFSDM